jgi:hypothetical protein
MQTSDSFHVNVAKVLQHTPRTITVPQEHGDKLEPPIIAVKEQH